MGDAGPSARSQGPKWSQMDKKQYFGKLLTMMVGMRTVLFPLQVVKTRLQFQNKADAQYSGTLDAIKKIARREGLNGFFKGYPISMLSLPAGFIYLTSLELSWQFLPSSLPPSLKDSLSGVAACAASQLWMVPVDVVSQHQQVNTKKLKTSEQVRQTTSLARTIFRNGGITGFYRGFWISLFTFGPQSAIFWGTFGRARRSLDFIPNQNLQVSLSAATASVFTNLITTPLDTVRARYQLSEGKTTSIQVFKELWKSERIAGLYKGYFARTLYGLLNSSPIVMGYFWIRRTSQKESFS